MKRLAISCLGLAIILAPSAFVLGQDERPAKEGDRPRDNAPEGERPIEGRGFRGGDGGFRGEGGREGQGRGEGGQRGGGAMMARLPIIMALDANQDGEISAEEIDLAVVALKKLDKNKDGKLTMDELAPNFGGMPGGMGPGGFGGGGFGIPGGNPEEMVNRMMENDKDNDGYLAESELPERMRPILERADANSDKKISREEIMAMMQSRGGATGRGQPGPGREGGAARDGAPGREGGAEGRQRPTSE